MHLLFSTHRKVKVVQHMTNRESRQQLLWVLDLFFPGEDSAVYKPNVADAGLQHCYYRHEKALCDSSFKTPWLMQSAINPLGPGRGGRGCHLCGHVLVLSKFRQHICLEIPFHY